jgi:hypothetical protein
LREDLPGFIFESNRGTKHSFTAETSLGPEFAAGWTGKRGKRLRSKIEAMKQKVRVVSFLHYIPIHAHAHTHCPAESGTSVSVSGENSGKRNL